MNKKNSLRVFSVTAWGAFVLSCLFVFPLLSACDVAYSASVTGTVVDKELYDQDPKTGAINNVFVYVYWNEKDRESDYRFWVKHNWKPEEKPATDEKGKKLKRLYNDMAVTNADGVFTFSALWWLDFFPEFGTDASVENAYFMFYHKDYGMVKYEKATLLTGDGRTRTLAPFPIVKQIHEAILKGRVIDKNRTLNGSPVGLPGVQVQIYTTDRWSVSGSLVTVKESDWNSKPAYTLTTDDDGYYNQIVSFRKYPVGSSAEVDKTQMLLTFSADNFSLFELTSEAHNRFSATNWTSKASYQTVDLKDPENWVLFDTVHLKKDFDVDIDGSVDVYYPVIVQVQKEESAASQRDRRKNSVTLADVAMRQTLLSAEIRGRVYEGSKSPDKDNGLNDATVVVKDFSDSTDELAGTTSQTNVIAQGQQAVIEKGSYGVTVQCRIYNYTGEILERPLFVQAKKDAKSKDNSTVNGGKVSFSTNSKVNIIDFELN